MKERERDGRDGFSADRDRERTERGIVRKRESPLLSEYEGWMTTRISGMITL